MGEGNEVFKLGLDVLAGVLALVGYCVVADVAFAVDLEGEGVSRGSL